MATLEATAVVKATNQADIPAFWALLRNGLETLPAPTLLS
jgi:hypothetical protein